MNTMEILVSIWSLRRLILEGSAPCLEAHRLSADAIILLSQIERFPYPADLAHGLFMTPPAVSYLLRQLEAREYLTREMDRSDLRRYRLRRTEKGTEALKQGLQCMSQVLEGQLLQLDQSEAVLLGQLLTSLLSKEKDASEQ